MITNGSRKNIVALNAFVKKQIDAEQTDLFLSGDVSVLGNAGVLFSSCQDGIYDGGSPRGGGASKEQMSAVTGGGVFEGNFVTDHSMGDSLVFYR